jgi:hypothetical protein
MLAKLEYNIPEEQEEFDIALNGWKYKLILFEFDSSLRNKLKYSSNLSNGEYSIYENLRQELRTLLNEHQVDLI